MAKIIEKIEATLKHGKICGKGLIVYLWISLVIFAILAVITTVFAFIYNIKLLIFLAFIVFVTILLVVLLVKDMKAKKEISEWLSDALELDAYCEEVYNQTIRLKAGCIGKIQVRFTYLDKKISVVSEETANSKFDAGGQYGSDKVFRKYINKEIRILYSPKNNQVMLLK